MKQIIILIAIILLIATAPNAHALFGRIAAEKQRRIETEQKLVQQNSTSSAWQFIAFVLGVGCVVTLVSGAAIGSRGRKNARPPQ